MDPSPTATPQAASNQLQELYANSPAFQQLQQHLAQGIGQRAAIQQATGSLLALYTQALYQAAPSHTVLVAEDRETANYLNSDLQHLLEPDQVWLFPASSKSVYQQEAVENANVLQRSEVLTALNQPNRGKLLVVTYPEALFEKVVDRKTLVSNTLHISQGDALDLDFVEEVLEDYDFEYVDFVYEPGQYAIRGGIVDVFSFSYDKPYRLQFKEEAVDSIRVFEPDSQLSQRVVSQISVIPNLQNTTTQEARISFLEYLPNTAWLLLQNLPLAQEELQRLEQRALAAWELQQQESGGQTLQAEPQIHYLLGRELVEQAKRFTTLEFAKKPLLPTKHVLNAGGKHQATFQKDFGLLSKHLQEYQDQAYRLFITCENPRQVQRLRELLGGEEAQVAFTHLPLGLHRGFVDELNGLVVYTDHQIFQRYHRFKNNHAYDKGKALSLQDLVQLKPGDYVTHINHGIGRFAGLQKLKVGEVEQEVIKIIYADGDSISYDINSLYKLAKYTGKEGKDVKLTKLGSQEWARNKAKVKKKLKALAFDLVELYAQRKARKGFAFGADSYLQYELEASFLYEETPDQLKTMEDVKADMEKAVPMDRLVCGDVGFGKTEIAVRAAFKAAENGKQVAVLAPTTVLTLQHFNTFSERMHNLPVTIDYLNRFKSQKEQKETLKRLQEGKIDILVGTHRLLSKDVAFKDLGLLVIDEEHKFGVGAKEKLRLLRAQVDTLALTATPIPRTLQFSLLNIRDLSIISTPPPNRQPVETVVFSFDQAVIRDAVSHELRRGGQVFFIHNRIRELEEIGALVKKLIPDARVAVAHGQMAADTIEQIMVKFIGHETDVLVSTTIVESGLDIPNANTILVNNAHTYGLSELHQLRGRVGRSNRKAYCYLFAPPVSTMPTDTRKRLQAMEEFTDLGSGFQIAMRDLDIRGAGDILGKEQSGFINEIGYDLYHKLLDSTIRELKAEHFPELEKDEVDRRQEHGLNEDSLDVQVDLDREALIPTQYIPNTAERLNLYKRLSNSSNEAELQELAREMLDRFGLLPQPTLTLMDSIRLRDSAGKAGFTRVAVKGDTLKAYFQPNENRKYYESPIFQTVIGYVQAHPDRLALDQHKDTLVLKFQPMQNLKEAVTVLRGLQQRIDPILAEEGLAGAAQSS